MTSLWFAPLKKLAALFDDARSCAVFRLSIETFSIALPFPKYQSFHDVKPGDVRQKVSNRVAFSLAGVGTVSATGTGCSNLITFSAPASEFKTGVLSDEGVSDSPPWVVAAAPAAAPVIQVGSSHVVL